LNVYIIEFQTLTHIKNFIFNFFVIHTATISNIIPNRNMSTEMIRF